MTALTGRLEALQTSVRQHPRRWGLGVAVFVVLAGALSLLWFAASVDALRARRAAGPSWAFPSRLYTAGLPLVPGRPLPFPYLRRQLAVRGYRQVDSPPRAPGTWAVGSRG